MPWKERTPVDERKHFIEAYRRADESVAELARRFGVSRKTAYKWIHRFVEGDDLLDRSRRPHSNARAVAPAMVDALVAARKARPRWGAKKLRAVLANANPTVVLPSVSAIAGILKRHGLVRPKRRRQRTPRSSAPFGAVGAPNDLWCIDFKGDFEVGGRRCYPLTITDAYSRYLVACVALRSTDERSVRRVLERVFFEFGLPRAIRSDNGSPFATRGLGGFSKLSLWWLKLGIRHERIQPGKPQQNGQHERMHLTMAQSIRRADTMPAQQRAFDLFRADFNDERPHEALGQRPPASRYQPSQRPLPIPHWGKDFAYPAHWERVRLSAIGVLVFNERRATIGQAFAHELIGLAWTEEGWEVYFGPVLLGSCRWTEDRRRHSAFKPAAHLSPMSVNKTVTHVSA